ncbi:unnamed protein product, partial [Meganyctiphanes norvegica]
TILMTFGCFSILYKIWRNKMKLKNLGMPKELVTQRTLELWRSTAVLLGLLILYLVCVVPVCITNMIAILNSDHSHDQEVKNIKTGIGVYMIYWIQYGINFLVYACGNPKIRKAHRQLPVLFKEKLMKLWFSKDKQDHELKTGSYRIGPAIISVTRFENNIKDELSQGISIYNIIKNNTSTYKRPESWPVTIPKETKEVKDKFGTFSSEMSWVSSNNTLESILTSKKSRIDLSVNALFKMGNPASEKSLQLPKFKRCKANDAEKHSKSEDEINCKEIYFEYC